MIEINPAVSVREFIGTIESPRRRGEAEILLEMFGRVTGEPAVMWGPSIIGFGQYHYEYASGHHGDACAAGFSPRKTANTIYLDNGAGAHSELLAKLGPHKSTVACLYITNLAKIDLNVLEQIVRDSYETVSAQGFGNRAADSSD